MTRTPHKHPRVGTGIRLHPWHYTATLSILIGVTLSGLVWAVLAEGMEIEAPSLRWLAQTHGALALLSLVVLGALLPQHVRFAWAARRNRKSGGVMLATFVLLAASGYGLYYGAEAWHSAVTWAHIAVGVLATLVFPIHLLLGRRLRHRH